MTRKYGEPIGEFYTLRGYVHGILESFTNRADAEAAAYNRFPAEPGSARRGGAGYTTLQLENAMYRLCLADMGYAGSRKRVYVQPDDEAEAFNILRFSTAKSYWVCIDDVWRAGAFLDVQHAITYAENHSPCANDTVSWIFECDDTPTMGEKRLLYEGRYIEPGRGEASKVRMFEVHPSQFKRGRRRMIR